MKRAEILDTAKECVCGQREQDYGSPEDNFKQIAKLWSAYKNVSFTPGDVAMMMALLKIARIQSGTGTSDSFVDLAGYAACGGEIATEKEPAPSRKEVEGDLISTIKKAIDDIITNGKRISNRYNFDEIVLDSRGEAEDVLENMHILLEEYGIVSVSDYFELVGMDTELIDINYGWASLCSAKVMKVKNGYIIRLPRPVYFNNVSNDSLEKLKEEYKHEM